MIKSANNLWCLVCVNALSSTGDSSRNWKNSSGIQSSIYVCNFLNLTKFNWSWLKLGNFNVSRMVTASPTFMESLWVHHHIHNSPPWQPIPRHLYTCSPEDHLDIFHPCMPKSSTWSLPKGFPQPKFCINFSFCPLVLYVPLISSLFIHSY